LEPESTRRPKTKVPRLFAFLAALVGLLGCGRAATLDSSETSGLVFANGVSAGCENPPLSTGRLPDDVDWIVARLLDTAGVEKSALVFSDVGLESPGEALMTGVPPGRYVLDVTGCSSGPKPRATWGGKSRAFEVLESRKSAPIVFMKRAGALSCVGGWNQSPLAPQFGGDEFLKNGSSAFAAGTVAQDGRVFVSGGFDQWNPKPTGDTLTAGSRLWQFDPRTGIFIGTFGPEGLRNALHEPRAMHVMVEPPGDQGMLLAIGGVRSAVLAPQGFPGDVAALDGADDVEFTVDVLDLNAGSSTGVKTATAGVQATLAVSRDRGWVALAGGRNPTDGKPADKVVFIETDASALLDGTVHVLEGSLTSPRFASGAVFLSTGDLVLVGGWTGDKPAASEMVFMNTSGALTAHELGTGGPPPNVSPTAYPSMAVLSDTGDAATLLIMGGNPLDDSTFSFTNPDPEKRTGWLLQLDADGSGHYDPDSATAVSLDEPRQWAVRSMASIVSVGDGEMVMAGGYRNFNEEPGTPGCGVVWGSFCFPRTLALFSVDGKGSGLVEDGVLEDSRSRLGALALPLDPGLVLVMGGMDGFGYPKTDDATAPPPPSTTPILSTGYLFVREGHFDPAVCADHPLH